MYFMCTYPLGWPLAEAEAAATAELPFVFAGGALVAGGFWLPMRALKSFIFSIFAVVF